MSLMGAPKLGSLKMMKKSALDFSEKRSLSLNILCKVKSAWEALKPRRALRERSPWPATGMLTKGIWIDGFTAWVGAVERHTGDHVWPLRTVGCLENV